MLTTLCAYLLIGIFFVMEARLRQGAEAKTLDAGKFDHNSTKYIGLAFGITLTLLLLAPVMNHFEIGNLNSNLIGIVGLVMMVAGLLLRYWASKTLGAFYTRTLLVKTEHRIVESGPYKLIRNPGYLGDLLLFIGAALATLNWIAVVISAVGLCVAYVYRIRIEETMLHTKFGEQYEAYRARSWRLIPLLY